MNKLWQIRDELIYTMSEKEEEKKKNESKVCSDKCVEKKLGLLAARSCTRLSTAAFFPSNLLFRISYPEQHHNISSCSSSSSRRRRRSSSKKQDLRAYTTIRARRTPIEHPTKKAPHCINYHMTAVRVTEELMEEILRRLIRNVHTHTHTHTCKISI